MKKLNNDSTRVFSKLLEKLGGKDYIQLKAEGFMPLSIELLGRVETAMGSGSLYSLSHTYTQNGDLMRDPEMCFIVVPGKDEKDTMIYPQMYQQDAIGLYEESVGIEGGRVSHVIMAWQQSHSSFANSWLKNIQQQGFLHESKIEMP